MRELKFRAYFNNKPKWCGHLFYSEQEDYLGDFFAECEVEIEKHGGGVFEQYTGLKDNTLWEDLTEEERKKWIGSGNKIEEWEGKEIYEGDIILLPSGVKREVIFKNGMFCIDGYNWNNKESKVIGNK